MNISAIKRKASAKLNSNIGCFEMNGTTLFLYPKSELNSNIGCFEMTKEDTRKRLFLALNSNIGCFEIFLFPPFLNL